MNIRPPLIIALMLLFISACSTNATVSQISTAVFSPTNTPRSSFDQPPSATLAQSTPPPTLEQELMVMTSEPPSIVMTALNLQLDSSNQKLTEASNQIATMASAASILETQLAAVSTKAAGGSSNPATTNDGYAIPSNVFTVVTVDRATIFSIKSYNKAGAPIMLPFEPRVVIPPGTEAWVYKESIKADGGAIYYESYDPDGESDLKVFFKASHIQIRLSNGNPNPDDFPSNVAKASFTQKTVLFVIDSYDKSGKPIMETYKPTIRYDPGMFEIVYPEFVVATGGSQWYPVYDPDGKPSGYLQSRFISFPQTWD